MHKEVNRDFVIKWIKDRKIGVLATSVNDIPWAATINYVIDDELNLFFFTRETSLKYKNILKNPIVSLVIDDQDSNGTVQIQGQAEHLKGANKQGNVKIVPSFVTYLKQENNGELTRVNINLKR